MLPIGIATLIDLPGMRTLDVYDAFIFAPFYVYAYAFGQLLVFSLYQQFKAEGESFKPRYLKILASGGSDAPAQVLSQAGIDIHSADFWQGGLNVLTALLDQLEALQRE